MVVLNNNKLLRNFNTPNNEEIIKGVGMYLHTKKKIF